MAIVKDFKELSEKTQCVRQSQSMPMIQEYIPQQGTRHFSLVLDKQGNLKATFCPKTLRAVFRIQGQFETVKESSTPHIFIGHAAMLTHQLGWWGGTTVQTKIDARDGIPKLMEINPRLGYTLWNRTELGINEPLMCLKIAHGVEFEKTSEPAPGKILVSPVEDLIGLVYGVLDHLLYAWRVRVLGKRPLDPHNPPKRWKEMFHSYIYTYINDRPKIFNPYFRYFFQDPLVSLLWWFQFLAGTFRAAKQLGK
jgi:hypothetical protein